MKFDVKKSSNWNYHKVVQINTLEELMKFVKDNGRIIIESDISPLCSKPVRPSIEIYDYWRE